MSVISHNRYRWKGPPPGELRKEIKLSAYLVNSIQKFRFPSTDVYLHPENQRQISIQPRDIED